MTSPRYPNGTAGVLARTASLDDPRLSAAQRAAIEPICRADAEARVLGLDDRHRPVVAARVGTPRTSRKWAILRNGDPADPGRIAEPWIARNPDSRDLIVTYGEQARGEKRYVLAPRGQLGRPRGDAVYQSDSKSEVIAEAQRRKRLVPVDGDERTYGRQIAEAGGEAR